MDAFCKELSGKELEEFCKEYDKFWLNMQKYIPIEGETPEEIASNYLKDQAEMTRHFRRIITRAMNGYYLIVYWLIVLGVSLAIWLIPQCL